MSFPAGAVCRAPATEIDAYVSTAVNGCPPYAWSGLDFLRPATRKRQLQCADWDLTKMSRVITKNFAEINRHGLSKRTLNFKIRLARLSERTDRKADARL